MAFTEGILTYILHKRKRPIDTKEEENFLEFCGAARKYYQKSNPDVSFKKILDIEKIAHSGLWIEVSEGEEHEMYAKARELDRGEWL